MASHCFLTTLDRESMKVPAFQLNDGLSKTRLGCFTMLSALHCIPDMAISTWTLNRKLR